MSRGTDETVECPLCGEAFDPTAAGGWCTNSDCGEWQYEAAVDETTDERSDERTGGTDSDPLDAGSTGERDSGSERTIDEPGEDRTTAESAEPTAESVESTNERTAERETAESEGGESDETLETTDEPGETLETTDEPGEAPATTDEPGEAPATTDETADATETEEIEPAEELPCPNCDEAVAPGDNFCSNCGEDVSALEPGPLTECPACEEAVEPDDNFCSNCGENLQDYRTGEPDRSTDEAATDQPAGEAATDQTAGEGAGDADTAEADAASTHEESDGSLAAEPDEGPSSLSLQIRGHELQVEDGETVGREIRKILIETGGDEDEAVRIHRDHVEFVREGGQFYLVALGRNPTVVNGERVEQGDRVPVSPGDRIELSNVANLRLGEP